MSLLWFTWILTLKAECRRILWNAAEHITLMISASAIAGLLFYVFHDFMIHQIATISPEVAQSGILLLASAVGAVAGVLARGTSTRLASGSDSFEPLMARVGCSVTSQRRLRLALRATVTTAFVAVLAVIFRTWQLASGSVIPWLVFLVTLAMPRREPILTPPSHNISVPRITDWRWHQLRYHRMPGRGLFLMGIVAALTSIPIALAARHYFVTQLIALLAGMISTWALATAIAADLPCTWFEKQAGMTHDTYIGSWQRLAKWSALILTGICSITATLSYISGQASVSQALTIALLAGVPPLMTPSMMLQIDGRARLTNLILLTLVHLFCGTAIIALPWTVLAVPIIVIEAGKYQQGRFYRA